MPNNFYRNTCMLLGSLKRGVILKTPFVTFPMSKVGLELAKILRNLGIVSSFECIQKRNKLDTSQYPKWMPGQPEPDSTQQLMKYPGMYLKLVMNCDKFKPHYVPKGASLTDITQSFHEHLPLSVQVMSSATKQQFVKATELERFKARYGPGVLLLSTDAGLLLDVEAELLNKGGIVLGFIGLPMTYVAQLRGMLRKKHQQESAGASREGEASTSGRTPLTQWSIQSCLEEVFTQRLAAKKSKSVLQRVEEMKARQQDSNALTRQVMETSKSIQEQLRLEQAILRYPEIAQEKLEAIGEELQPSQTSWIQEQRNLQGATRPGT